ncbi:MAG: efflux RND transporter periplasmic adaptor subunit [Bacillota bacterium]
MWERLKRRKKMLAGAGFIVLVGLAVALNLVKNREGGAVPVQTARAEFRELQDSVFATGRVRLVEKQEVFSEEVAIVKKIFVRPGDRVTRGQLLVSMDDGDAESRLKEARANLDLQEANYAKALAALPLEGQKLGAEVDRAEAGLSAARAKYQRYQSLFQIGAASAQELEEARLGCQNREADLKSARASFDARASDPVRQNEIKGLEAQVTSARAQYEKAQKQYGRTNVRAEMDGMVFSVEVSEGDQTVSRTRILTLGNPDRLEVTASISEGDSGRLVVGQRAEVKAAALPGSKYRGTLTMVAPGAVIRNNERGGFSIEIPVHVRVEGDAAGLRPGYTADVSIITVEKRTALAVPYESVVEKDGKKYVLVIENGRAKETKIKTGLNTEIYTEVLEGLGEGDKVIVNPGDKVMDGTAVKELPGIKEVPREAGK